MIDLEKLPLEQRKICDSLMQYDSVMTDWINESEENKVQYRRNPLKTFLSVTGMGKSAFVDLMSPLANKEVLLKQVGDEEEFTLKDATTDYTNGWDIVNLATLDIVNMAFSKLFSNGVKINVPITSEDKKADLILETNIDKFIFTDLNGALANMEIQSGNCTLSGTLDGKDMDCTIGSIVITFQVKLEEVSLETESGKKLELYLDLKADNAIRSIIVDAECDSFILKCVLDEILPTVFEKIIGQIPIEEPYKICTVEIDEETQNKINWLIPDVASFSGSSVFDKDGVEKKEVAVFAKTLDKDLTNLFSKIESQFVDSRADGTLGIAERIILGYALPVCIASSLKIMEETSGTEVEIPPMQYVESEKCLKIDKTITVEESGAVVNIKDFKIVSMEEGFRLSFSSDGNWGAGMVTFDATGFADISLSFTKDESGEHLTATVSNPTLDYNIDIPWWEWLILALLIVSGLFISFVGVIIAGILGTILGIASGIIDSIMKAIQENGIDGLPITVEIPIQWNNLKVLDIQSMSFSKGMQISYSMQLDEEKIAKEEQKLSNGNRKIG